MLESKEHSSLRFVDQEQYDSEQYTALAMAELYASIASMPDGADKQKRLKQVSTAVSISVLLVQASSELFSKITVL